MKADLDGTIFTYDHRARLTWVMTSRQMSCKLESRYPYDTSGCRKLELCVCGWSIVILFADDSRRQKSYHLNRPLVMKKQS